ncbi:MULTISPECIES: hypothetical protein [Vibrio]|uniref:hypothetical protein n=1 Tax=Vibrio TaxID=662 RepID=UPI00056F0197|nr:MULTISPECIES: hypothetical protein [Vibrio]MDW1965353.1 hypothetical protein [Vibrio sp. Vb0587]
MNKEVIFNQTMNFSTIPDAIFSLCGIAIIVGILYLLIKTTLHIALEAKTNSNENNEKLPPMWIPLKTFILIQLILGSINYSGKDERYTHLVEDFFGSTILGYHLAGFLLSIVFFSFIIVLIKDAKLILKYIRSKKRA